MADLLWRSTFDGPSPLTGNCAVGANEWCNAQLARIGQIQAQPPWARFEVRHGDVYRNYSDARALLTGPASLWAYEGDVRLVAFSVKVPATTLTRYPKQDELQSWINNPQSGAALNGGAIAEWHHDMGGQIETGSAPLYLFIADGKFRLQIIDQIVGSPTFSAPLASFDLAAITYDVEQRFVLGVGFSADKAKGWVCVYDASGAPLMPRQAAVTIRPGSKASYFAAGLYRRDTIGDPQYVWPAGAKPGVMYPDSLVPVAGGKVYPQPGGYPGVVYLGNFALGATKESVMASQVAPPAPSVDPIAAAPLLIATRDALVAQAQAAQAQADAITALLNKGRWTGTVK